jgi:hypothetical protein
MERRFFNVDELWPYMTQQLNRAKGESTCLRPSDKGRLSQAMLVAAANTKVGDLQLLA